MSTRSPQSTLRRPNPSGLKTLHSVLVCLSALTLLLLIGCSDGDDGNPVVETDVTAPGAVTDLRVTATTHSEVTLQWTAPGDDGSEGTSDSYDVRYDTETITDATWGSTVQVTGEPTPRAAGTTESHTASDLADTTVYYFAMKTADEEANISILSNVVACTTRAVPPGPLDLAGYWMLLLVSDSEPDPEDRGDVVEIAQTSRDLTMLSQCFDGTASGEVVGDSVYFDVDDEVMTLVGEATSNSMRGTWTGEDEGESDAGTWTATRMDRAPDAHDCVEVNADVFCGRSPEDDYVIIAQLDDHAGVVESASVSGEGISGSFPLSDTLFPEEENEWWTDPLDPGLTISSGQPPVYPLEYTISIEFTDGGSRDIARVVTRSYDVDLPDCQWQTVFTDEFGSTTLDPRWDLFEGDASLFVLDGQDLAVDDSDLYTDGPMFVHSRSADGDRVRITCRVRTEEMNGEVQLVLGMGDESAAYVFGLWDGLRIIRDVGDGDLLAYDSGFFVAANDNLWFVCEVEEGELRVTVRDTDGNIRAFLSADDPSPLPLENIFFGGEVDGTEGEYLHFDDFTLEECTD